MPRTRLAQPIHVASSPHRPSAQLLVLLRLLSATISDALRPQRRRQLLRLVTFKLKLFNLFRHGQSSLKPVGQLPTLCIPASKSSSLCWYAMRGVLIHVTMIGAPAARTADFLATTLFYMRATLDTRVSFDQCLTSPPYGP